MSIATEQPKQAPAQPQDDGSPALEHSHEYTGRDRDRRRLRAPSAGWTGTVVRLVFGLVWAIDAYLKWQPGYRSGYLSQLQQTAQGQPSWLHGWFQFWIQLQSGAPSLFATLTGVVETSLALCLLFGLARRAAYSVGVGYTLMVWAVGEGFGGPYVPGTTDVGTAIPYAIVFITLLVYGAPARRERFSLDKFLERRLSWWRFVAEPHAVDRVHGAPLVEPMVVGEVSPPRRRLRGGPGRGVRSAAR